MRRRDLILGALGVCALASAEALRPRKRLVLLPKNSTIEKSIPLSFSGWEAQSVDDLVGPAQAGRLARALYSETVARIYFEEKTGKAVMMLAAYGDTQSDLLQLHRPESCYPAVGFTLRSAESVSVPLPGGVILPARRVIAYTEQRTEDILYWARMGEALPRTGGEQRMARLQNAMQGYVPDGILVRCSTIGATAEGYASLQRFVGAMLEAVEPANRPALVGADLARRIA